MFIQNKIIFHSLSDSIHRFPSVIMFKKCFSINKKSGLNIRKYVKMQQTKVV